MQEKQTEIPTEESFFEKLEESIPEKKRIHAEIRVRVKVNVSVRFRVGPGT